MSARESLKGALKLTARKVLGAPIFRPVSRVLAGRGTCLMYHRVFSPDAFERSMRGFSPNRELAVSLEAFDRQMDYISKNFHCISVPDAIQALKTGSLGTGSVMVTFDDGYRDNLLQALPVLKKYKVPVTIYITTSMIDGGLLPWWYEEEAILRELERVDFSWNGEAFQLELGDANAKQAAFNRFTTLLKTLSPSSQRDFLSLLRNQLPTGVTPMPKGCEFLSWDEVATLTQEPLVTIGAHTRSHFVSSSLSVEELRHEIEGSRTILEEKLARKIEHFAYPFGGPGEAAEREFQVVSSLGFASAFTTRLGHLHLHHRDSLFALPRVVIGCHDTVEDLQWKLTGFDSTLKNLKQRLSA